MWLFRAPYSAVLLHCRTSTNTDSDHMHPPTLAYSQGVRSPSDEMLTNSPDVITSLTTIFETYTVVRTVTTPTQTLYTTTCAPSPDEPAVITPPTSTTTTTSAPVVVPPVTLTRIVSSTDTNGKLIISTVEIVSTPSPDSTQSGSGSGGPNTPAIIGGAVGGVVVGLIALIGIIWFIKNKRRTGGHWDDTWEEDDGHQAGAAEVKYGAPATTDYGSSPTHGIMGSETQSPLLRGDQPSGLYSHSRSTSTATGYATHTQSNNQMPFTLATSPPHSPPPQQQQPLPAAGAAGLDRTRTPIWARPSEQQGYIHPGSSPIPSDPNYPQTMTSTYNATSHPTPATTYSTHTRTTANPVVAYAPAAAPPIVEKRHSTYKDHKAPLEQSQHGSAGQPSQRKKAGSSGSTTKSVHAPIDKSAKSELVAASPTSVHTPSNKDRGIDLNGAPTSQVELPRVVEDSPPAYAQ